ncbi:MAG TPA: hypothetical protein VMW31_01055, partial [Devosiaceae bacterium]|nr:hypothetical protein [Devosiaceae bacterium]
MAHDPAADPQAGFSDMQWFMRRQRNVVFYVAFSATPLDRTWLEAAVTRFAALSPQAATGYRGARPGTPLDPATIRAVCSMVEVDSFAGFPAALLDDGFAVFADPGLPLFRFVVANRRGGADENGRAGLLTARVSHTLVEGADAANLTRSHSAARSAAKPPPASVPPHPLAAVAAAIAVPLHLIAGNLLPAPTGGRRFATRVWDRRQIAGVAG